MQSVLNRINSAVCKFTVGIDKNARISANIRPYITKDVIKNSVNSDLYILKDMSAHSICRIILWTGGDISYDNDYWIHLPIRTDKEITIKNLIELVEKAESKVVKEEDPTVEAEEPEIVEESPVETKVDDTILTNAIKEEIPTLDKVIIASESVNEDEDVEEPEEDKKEENHNIVLEDTIPHLPRPPYDYASRRHHKKKK